MNMLLTIKKHQEQWFLQVRTPYTENWKNNQTAEWYASKKVTYIYVCFKYKMKQTHVCEHPKAYKSRLCF